MLWPCGQVEVGTQIQKAPLQDPCECSHQTGRAVFTEGKKDPFHDQQVHDQEDGVDSGVGHDAQVLWFLAQFAQRSPPGNRRAFPRLGRRQARQALRLYLAFYPVSLAASGLPVFIFVKTD